MQINLLPPFGRIVLSDAVGVRLSKPLDIIPRVQVRLVQEAVVVARRVRNQCMMPQALLGVVVLTIAIPVIAT